MIQRFAILVYPDHHQFKSANEHILAVSFHGADHFPGTLLRGDPPGQCRIHNAVFFAILQQGMVGDIGAHPTRTEDGYPDPFLAVLGPYAFVKAKQGMLGGRICTS